MSECVLAVDIGASSGRVMASFFEDGSLQLEEIHRFSNGISKKDRYFCWDIDRLFEEIITGMKIAGENGWKPKSIGIDTWAVDFVLLDQQGNRLTDAVSYRDPRVDGMMEEVTATITKDEIYAKTGIQFLKFNTMYQLYYLKKNYPRLYEEAATFLMIPDYLNFLLTGKKVNEYTNATTTQLVEATGKNWDADLIDRLELKSEIFQEIVHPGTSLGNLDQALVEEIGYDVEVIVPATHDTASAVVAVPENEKTIYLSSGTWSLIGVENEHPICDESALLYNFTNEGGFKSRYRFLKNIMGLWMIQEVKRNYNDQYSFEQFAEMADSEQITSIVNVDDACFLNPENMVKEIQSYCEKTKQPVPETAAQIAKVVYDSLTHSYKSAVDQIEKIMGQTYETIHIIGGGSKNERLNNKIAQALRKKVIAGPSEATALGNCVVQWIENGEIANLEEARTMIRKSTQIKVYTENNEGVEKNDSAIKL